MNPVYYALREFYLDHPACQQAFALSTRARARRARRQGRLNLALNHYCDAFRRLITDNGRNPELRRRGIAELAGFVREAHGGCWPASPAANRFVQAFLASPAAAAMRQEPWQAWPPERRSRLGDESASYFLVLKAPRPNERGVLMVKYTPYFERLLTLFRLGPLFERFTVVLEPSWTPYPETFWALFAGASSSTVCQSITPAMHDALTASGLPITSMLLGPQEWVDDRLFRPLGLEKEFDVVMVASFAKIKRHAVLFRALRELRPRRLKVALVGTAWLRGQNAFERELRAWGVREDCTLFRALAPEQVNEVLNRSRVAVMLTRVEGGNKAVMEALAANVPVITYRGLVGPVHHITPATGRLASDHELARVLAETLAAAPGLSPRAWFDQHSGYRRATARLNDLLRAEAARRGEPWTADIVAKVNRPYLAYADPEDEQRLAAGRRELTALLAPAGAAAAATAALSAARPCPKELPS